MKIGLLTTLNTNIGDDFIREGITGLLRNMLCKDELKFVPVNKHRPYSMYPVWTGLQMMHSFDFMRNPRKRLLREKLEGIIARPKLSCFSDCDIVIQCGTPILWEGCRLSEWANPVWRDVLHWLSRRGKAVLNIGGGASYPWERRPQTLVGDDDEEFVRLMLDACRLTTVRDQLSQNLLKTLGREVEMICCPALLSGQLFVRPRSPTRKVVVNYMEGGGHYDWGQNIDADQWSKAIAKVVSILSSEGWRVVLLAHDRKEMEMAQLRWPQLEKCFPQSVNQYFDFISDAAFGVFNRMHASIAAAGVGVPSVAIGTDARNLMVEAAGLPVLFVKDATVDSIISETRRLANSRDSECQRLLNLRAETWRRYEECIKGYLRT